VTRRLSTPTSGFSTRATILGAIAAGAAVLGFCLLLFCHDPQVFWNDDYEISILPVFADVARSWSEGQFPLLSPYSWICGNLAGEFQYGVFSIFINAAVLVIWKFPLTFPQQAAALSMIHLTVLAAGGYVLSRGRSLNAPFSMMVAFVVALNGWIICWGASDWFGALGAFAWLPWAWWGLERALDRRHGRWRFVFPAPFIYLLVTGGFPYTVLMLAVVSAWLALKSVCQTGRLASVWPLVAGLLLGLGLAAPAWLALLDHIQGSARQMQPASFHLQWLVPAGALPGFLLPNWTTHWVDFSNRFIPHSAVELACGLVAPTALVAGLINRGPLLVRRIKWELGLLIVVLFLSMVPSVNVFRWSFRWLPFLHLVLALCGAEALQLLNSAGDQKKTKLVFSTTPGTWAFILLVLVVSAMEIAHAGGRYASPITQIMLALAAAWMAIDLLPAGFRPLQLWMPAGVTFIALLATYICLPTNYGVPRYPFSQDLLSPAPLDSQRLYLSIYPPPEIAYRKEIISGPVGVVVRPGSTSMWAGVHLINGYSPIRSSGVARDFASAIHGEIDPGVADYLLGWQAGPDGELAKLGVDGIIVAGELNLFPKPEAEWSLVFSSKEGRVYHRRGAHYSHLRSLTSLDSSPEKRFVPAAITLVENARSRVVADITVPAGQHSALIALSRPYFRGYQARLGSKDMNVTSYRGLMPLVEIPSGTSGRLTIIYRPWWLVWGGVAATLSFFFLFSPALLRLLGRASNQ